MLTAIRPCAITSSVTAFLRPSGTAAKYHHRILIIINTATDFCLLNNSDIISKADSIHRIRYMYTALVITFFFVRLRRVFLSYLFQLCNANLSSGAEGNTSMLRLSDIFHVKKALKYLLGVLETYC